MAIMLVNALFEEKLDQLFEAMKRAAALLEEAGVEYQFVGGMATYLHVNQIDPMEARLTRDVDVCIRRRDLAKITELAGSHGFQFRHVAGIDMLVDFDQPKAYSAVHLVFAGEFVRAHELAVVPEIEEPDRIEDFRIAPVFQLLIMKLTSNRLKDMTHIRDMLNVGLITGEMEDKLPQILRERFEFIKAHE